MISNLIVDPQREEETGSLVVIQYWLFFECCFTSTATVRTITVFRTVAEDGYLDFNRALLYWLINVQCYFTPTETIRAITDEVPRTATSAFTQLMSSDIDITLWTYTHHVWCRPQKGWNGISRTSVFFDQSNIAEYYFDDVYIISPQIPTSIIWNNIEKRSVICCFYRFN